MSTTQTLSAPRSEILAYDNTRLRREVGRYLRTLPDRGLSERYKQGIRLTLLRFNEHCREQGIKTVRKVKRDTITTFLAKYECWSGSHQRQTACAMRMFLNHFENKAIRKLRIRVTGPSRTHVDWLSPEEAERVFAVTMSLRQSILIGAGLLQGMRRIETIRMTVKDAQEALTSGILRVRGKGYKERAIPLHDSFRFILSNYLSQVELDDRTSTLLGLKRTRSEEELDEFCSRFGKKFTFHTLRRTFGRNLWLLGVRLETVSELLGHSSTDMTRLYLGLDLVDMKKALATYKIGCMPTPSNDLPTNRAD